MSPAQQEEIAARRHEGETAAETAREMGLSGSAVLAERKTERHQGLMRLLAERHLEELAQGMHQAMISALADLTSGEWQARDRAREWLLRAGERIDASRGLLAQVTDADASGKPTLTEVLMVLRQTQVEAESV